MSKKQLAAIAPHGPDQNDQSAWLQLGRLLRGRHTELAADCLTFADVVRYGRSLSNFPDLSRWQSMQAAQDVYLRTLDDLKLWDIQTARRKAIEFKEIATDNDIVLLGTVDLNRTLRTMLDMVCERVTALIAAPESLAERFDSHGCVVPEQWSEVPLPLSDDQLRRVDRPADQADAVAQIMAGYGGRYRGDQVTIGVPDETLVPHLQRQLVQCGIPVRWVEGKLLPATGPFRLLEAIAELFRTENMRAFAALVRHPDVFEKLTFSKEESESRVALLVLDELDELRADYLLTRTNPAQWPPEVRRKLDEHKVFGNVVRALEQISDLLEPLRARPQRLSSWSKPLAQTLQSVYAERCEELATLSALEKIRDVLQRQAMLPEALDPQLPVDDAIAWTLDQLRGEAIPPPANEDAVELLGWLELPLDDAPAVIVTTFNDGFLPQATAGDSFLPNTLRKSLGLLDNDRRYARDAYAVSTLLASRESVQFVSGRRDAEDDPLIPSRLAFAAEPKKVVERALQFFQPLPPSPPRMPLIGAGIPAPASSRLFVPYPPGNLELPQKLRVTQFRDYLSCPYRFCLKYLLKLEAIDDLGEELAANAFGNLLHNVLERFGADPTIRESTSPDDIFEYLADQLDRGANRRYGDRDRLAAVDIQVEQLRARLERFAHWQARHRAEGWHIEYSETTKDGEATTKTSETEVQIEVDGVPFTLGGRIDRIDKHDDRDAFQVFDYKTGDRGDTPEQVHCQWREGQRHWVDLQLPLYRYLAAQLGCDGLLQLGYIVIPKALDDIGEVLARWTDSDLASADEAMRRVVRGIRQRQFWPPQDLQWAHEFDALCQVRRQGGPLYEQLLAEATA